MEVIIVNPEDKLPVGPLVDVFVDIIRQENFFKEFELWKRRKRYKDKKEASE